MNPKTKPPGDQERKALKARLAAWLTEVKGVLGPKDGPSFANAAFSECSAQVFAAPSAIEAPVQRQGPVAGPASREALKFDYKAIVGRSPAILGVLGMLDRVIESDLTVLITGESGTGKELIARAVHELGPRKDRPFVRENCAAIPETLLESELFGYRKGAFTGATHDKRGLFEEGSGGSVFLDEIAEMSISMQAKLMRVLQEGEIRAVGAPDTLRVDVRLITATNRDLRTLVAAGRFREDLFFRLNVVPIHAPALRERTGDIPLLADVFLRNAAERTRSRQKTLEPEALACLMRHEWPGNIRELENEIARACALSGPIIRLQDLSPEVQPPPRKQRTSSNPKAR